MSVGAGHISEVLQQIKEILARVKDPMRDDWDPILLSLLISKLEYEDLDIAAQMQNFSTLVNEVEQGLPKNSNLKDQTAHVISVFAGALQFEGDKTNYYNIKNAFMSDVLVRRKGIPISLCLTFMGLCRGVGLRSVGISFPGHFLVRMVPVLDRKDPSNNFEEAEDWKQQWFVDCFDRGALMSVQDCERRLNEWTRGAVPFGPEALKVAHPTEIVSRMLRNLRAIFMEKEDLARLYWVLSALIELCPVDRAESYKDRGILMGRTGRYSRAVEDFKEYLASCPDPIKRGHVEGMLRFFENQTELPN